MYRNKALALILNIVEMSLQRIQPLRLYTGSYSTVVHTYSCRRVTKHNFVRDDLLAFISKCLMYGCGHQLSWMVRLNSVRTVVVKCIKKKSGWMEKLICYTVVSMLEKCQEGLEQ